MPPRKPHVAAGGGKDAMNNVHPAFAGALASFVAVPHMVERAEYLGLLASADWFHEFSDCSNTHRRGKAQFERIRELQPRADPTRELFNAARPKQHGAVRL